VQDGAADDGGVCLSELAGGDPVGEDPGHLVGQVVHVVGDHLAGGQGQLVKGGEQLGIVGGDALLGGGQQHQPVV